MPPMVIPNMMIATIHGRYLGRPMEQVHAFRLTENVPLVNLDQEAFDWALEKIATGWRDTMLSQLSTSYSFDGVSGVDISKEDGLVGFHAMAETGANPGAPYISNAAVVVEKGGSRVRGARQGRMFIGGVVEGQVDGNELTNQVHGEFQTAVSNLRSHWEETGVIMDYHLQPAVIHTRGGVPWGVSTVTSYTTRRKLSHQDRRLTGRG